MSATARRLRDILSAIDAIERHSSSEAEFRANELHQIWMVHHLQIIGEASSGIDRTWRDAHPSVDWAAIIGMRQVLVHRYWRVDLDGGPLVPKTPDGVEQELLGLLLTYNLVRREMLLPAESHEVPPQRISFWSSLLWIRNFWAGASPGTIPKHLGDRRSTLKVLILPPRRSERRFPRHVKIKMSHSKRNRGRRAPTTEQPRGKELK